LSIDEESSFNLFLASNSYVFETNPISWQCHDFFHNVPVLPREEKMIAQVNVAQATGLLVYHQIEMLKLRVATITQHDTDNVPIMCDENLSTYSYYEDYE